MFNLQIIGNWNELFNGIELVTNGGARVFYVCQWVIMVLILVNVKARKEILFLVLTFFFVKDRLH